MTLSVLFKLQQSGENEKKLLMSFYEVNITLKPDEECTHKKGKNIDQSELLTPILKSYIE